MVYASAISGGMHNMPSGTIPYTGMSGLPRSASYAAPTRAAVLDADRRLTSLGRAADGSTERTRGCRRADRSQVEVALLALAPGESGEPLVRCGSCHPA